MSSLTKKLAFIECSSVKKTVTRTRLWLVYEETVIHTSSNLLKQHQELPILRALLHVCNSNTLKVIGSTNLTFITIESSSFMFRATMFESFYASVLAS